MASIVYLLSTATSVVCAVLLFRAFVTSKIKLLMWSALCFAGLAVNNALLIVDLLLVPQSDLALCRQIAADISIGILALGLAWESR